MLTIEAVSPATDEAQELIRELNMEIAALYPGLPIDGIDVAEFESAGGYSCWPGTWKRQWAVVPSDRSSHHALRSSECM